MEESQNIEQLLEKLDHLMKAKKVDRINFFWKGVKRGVPDLSQRVGENETTNECRKYQTKWEINDSW
jgi:hypothetical protein